MFTALRRIAALLAVIPMGTTMPTMAQQPVGFADALLGRWDLTITDGMDTWPSWLEVRLRTEGELMGRFVGRFGSVRHLPEITWNGGVLEFSAPPQYERGDRSLVFLGQLHDGRLEGDMSNAEGHKRTWIGIRAPESKPFADRRVGEPIDLFNGHDLSGWRARFGDAASCWSVIEDALTVTPPCVDLISEMEFSDFELSLEFNFPTGSNSGVYLRGRHEVQIQDTAGQALDALRMGAIYGFIAPAVDAAGAPGGWQSLNVRLIEHEVTVSINGATVIDAEQIPGITGGALDSREGEPGPVMLQGDHGPIRFRNIVLTPLTRN